MPRLFRAFSDPHFAAPPWVRWTMAGLLVGGGLAGVFWLLKFEHEEKTLTDFPVHNREEPIARETRTVQLPHGRNYVQITIPFESVAMNKRGHIVGFEKREDGRLDLLLWIVGDTFNVSEIAGETFSQVLDINDENEVLAVVKRDGQVYLKGYAYTPLPNQQIRLEPLKRIDLRRFGLESLEIETDLTLDSTLSEVEGRKVKVRSILDMTEQGLILGKPGE